MNHCLVKTQSLVALRSLLKVFLILARTKTKELSNSEEFIKVLSSCNSLQNQGIQMSEYTQVRLRKAIVERIEKIIRKHPEYGYKNLGDFIDDAVVGSLKKIKHMLCLYTIVLGLVTSFIAYIIIVTS